MGLFLADALFFLTLVVAPLLYGSVHLYSLLLLAGLAVLIFTGIVFARPWALTQALRAPWTWLGLAIGTVIFAQMVPLPVEWIRKVAPETARFYELYFPGGVRPGSAFTLSICFWDTVRELIQFATYGLFFISIWLRLVPDPESEDQEVHVVSWQKSEFLRLGCLAGIFALLFHSIYDFNLHIPANGIYFVTLLALGAGASNRNYDHAFFRRAIDFIAIFGFLVALFAILQKFSYNGHIFWIGIQAPSAIGPYYNYDHYAGFMELCTAVAIAKVAASVFHTSAVHCKGLAQKIFWLSTQEANQALRFFLMSAVMIATIFMSASRGGIMSFALSQIIFFSILFWTVGRKQKGKRLFGIMTAVILFAGVMVLWLGPQDFLKRFHMTSIEKILRMEGRDALRLNFYDSTLDVIRDFSTVGTGFGTFGTNFTRYRFFDYLGGRTDYLRYAHNDYLQGVSELGVAGALFIFGFMIFYLHALIRVARALE